MDQTTFGARPDTPAPDRLTEALAAGARIPLITIRDGSASEVYDEALSTAVDEAEARKPGVMFELVTVVPAKGSSDEQTRAIEQGQSALTGMMGKLADDGVDPARIHLAAGTDPWIATREIRLYVH